LLLALLLPELRPPPGLSALQHRKQGWIALMLFWQSESTPESEFFLLSGQRQSQALGLTQAALQPRSAAAQVAQGAIGQQRLAGIALAQLTAEGP